MDFNALLSRSIQKVKERWKAFRENRFIKKIISLWRAGKIQRWSRISYDISWNTLLGLLLITFVTSVFAAGIGAGYFASLVKNEPVRDYESMQQDINHYEETSSLYFADNEPIGDLRSDIDRDDIPLENVSDLLKDAVIATEDEHFTDHNGVMPKAIVRALLQQAGSTSIQSGGSTLTQQLVKNQIFTNEVTFDRKAKEILTAMRLERFFDKDEILEAYLNIVPFGRDASGSNIGGVQTAAEGIFGIDASEVNLPQAAYIAGLPQSPSTYTPFKNSGGLKDKNGIQPGLDRMHSVLNRMYESDYITKKQYDKALNYDVTSDFTEESQSPVQQYPYLTFEAEKRARDIILDHMAEKDGYSAEDLENNDDLKKQYYARAERSLRQDGYQIQTTIDKSTHDAFKNIAEDYEHYGPDWTGYVENESGEQTEITQPVQTGGILMENATGRIISFVGGRHYSQDNQLNYATSAKRSNGSTMKPILAYAPAFEKGVIQPGTPIADVPVSYGDWSPNNYGGGYHGLVSARKALFNSYNIPAIDVYNRINDQDPVSEFLEPMGISSLGEKEYANLSLSIGATTRGVTVEENVSAFATLGNQGESADSHMIEKITDQHGNVIYEHKPDTTNVFSPETAYLTLDIMRDVINKGTGTYLNSQMKHPNVDWTGKTGTSQNYKDAWFVGVNPHVSMGVWMGYDRGKSLQCPTCALSYSQRTQKLWAELINKASDIQPELVAPDENFERPDGIVSRKYCGISGMLPSDLCAEAGLIKTDLFNAKYVPTKKDDSLIKGSSAAVDGQTVKAGTNTPEEFVRSDGLTFNPEFLQRKGYSNLNDLSQLFPRTNRDKWEKIGFPKTNISQKTAQNDGTRPASPTNAALNGNTLSWHQSPSHDVVGYRIYHAKNQESSFSLVGNTTEASLTISKKSGIYQIRAVDYSGRESKASLIETGK